MVVNIKVQHTINDVSNETLVIGVYKHFEQMENWTHITNEFGEQFNNWLRAGDISTDVKSITKIPVQHKVVKRIIFVGLGEAKKLTTESLRQIFGIVGNQIRKQKTNSFSISLDSFETEFVNVEQVANLAGEGIGLGHYKFADYKTSSNEPDVYLDDIEIISSSNVGDIFKLGMIYATATNEARTLVNLPPNLLTATELANYAVKLAEKYGFEVEVLSKAELTELGMGGILAVNQGSTEEPKLITLKYKATETWEDVIGLVGKGVTYDTGGYSIKPREGMVGMKGDMGGAAAVLGAMQIVGETKPNRNVVAVIGSTDNMISGTAFKPDDVITTYSGKTVEVLNTDAEGRLVLADAVTYAKQQGANYLIDLATLTGGVIVALGMDKTGALTNDDAFYRRFVEVTKETDEFVWQLPLTENDKKRIRKSDMADLNNSPGRDGHMIFAGGFVGEFAEDTPWIHLDIAGTSEAQAAHDLGPKGGTGVMVRSVAKFISKF